MTTPTPPTTGHFRLNKGDAEEITIEMEFGFFPGFGMLLTNVPAGLEQQRFGIIRLPGEVTLTVKKGEMHNGPWKQLVNLCVDLHNQLNLDQKLLYEGPDDLVLPGDVNAVNRDEQGIT